MQSPGSAGHPERGHDLGLGKAPRRAGRYCAKVLKVPHLAKRSLLMISVTTSPSSDQSNKRTARSAIIQLEEAAFFPRLSDCLDDAAGLVGLVQGETAGHRTGLNGREACRVDHLELGIMLPDSIRRSAIRRLHPAA